MCRFVPTLIAPPRSIRPHRPRASAQVANIVYVQINAPSLFHLAPHFFLGFGPNLTADLHNSTPTLFGSSNRRTNVGASSLVGGWF
jgi:hypothetical protein